MEEPEELEQPLKKQKDLFDEKSLHELLYDHQSQDFKKARRNLMVIAFIVISIGFLELEIQDLNVFGLTLEKIPNPSRINLVGITLLGYWYIMFELYRKRDKDIHSLHHDIIHKKISALQNEIPRLQEEHKQAARYSRGPGARPEAIELTENLLQQIQDRQYAIEIFNESTNQNKPTLDWVLNVEKLELWLPRIFVFYSLSLLIFWLIF